MKKKIAIAVAAVAIVLIGVMYWQTQKTDENSSDNTQTNTTTDPSEGGKYLVIEEMGIKIPLNDKIIGDINYKFIGDRLDGGKSVLFESKRLVDLTGDSSCTINKQTWGYAGGLDSNLIATGSNELSSNKDFELIAQLDGKNFYTNIDNPDISCITGVHDDLESIEKEISRLLRESLQRIQTLK